MKRLNFHFPGGFRVVPLLLLVLVCFGISGCLKGDSADQAELSKPLGALSMKVSLASGATALSYVKPSSIRVTVGNDSLQKISTLAITESSGTLSLPDMPTGTSIPVVVEALDASGVTVYRGSANATFTAGATTVLTITLYRVFDMTSYFPIAQGNSWQYSDYSQEIPGTVIFNGTTSWEFRSTHADSAATVIDSDYFALTDSSLLIMGSVRDQNTQLTVLDPPISIPRYLQVGQVFTSTHRALSYTAASGTTVCPETTPKTQSPVSTTSFESRIEVQGTETVTTDSGLVFAESLRVYFSAGPGGSSDSPMTINFAQSVGMVRESGVENGVSKIRTLLGAYVSGISLGTGGSGTTPDTTPTAEIWVDSTAASGGTGTSASPFNTLPAALDALNSYSASSYPIIKLVSRSSALTLDSIRTLAVPLYIQGGYANPGDTAPSTSAASRTMIDLTASSSWNTPALNCNAGVTLKNLYFTGPGATSGAGAISLSGGLANIDNCSFYAFLSALVTGFSSTAPQAGNFITNCEFSSCGTALPLSYLNQTTISGSSFSSCVWGASLSNCATVSISNLTFTGSSAGSSAGGLGLDNCSAVTISTMTGSYLPTGLMLSNCQAPSVADAHFLYCTATSVAINSCSNVNIRRVKVLGYSGTGCTLTAVSGTFSNFIMDTLDTLYTDFVINAMMVSNSSGLYLRNGMIHRATVGMAIASSSPSITNCIIDTCNTGIQETDLTSSPINLSYNIFHETSYSDLTSGPKISNYYSSSEFLNILGTSTMTANQVYSISEQPPAAITTNPTGSDYTLPTGSPAINAGDPAVYDRDGSRSDIGPYGGTESFQ